MPTLLDHALGFALVVLVPLAGRRVAAPLLAEAGERPQGGARLRLYRLIEVVLAILALAILASWAALRRPWSSLGLVPVWNGGLIGIGVGLGLFFAILFRQGPDERAAEALRRRTVAAERLMPRSTEELRAWSLLVLVAGVGAEIVYRGFVIAWLASLGLALLPAAVVSAVIFGLAHLYQGARGVTAGTILGAFLAALYLLSGSLFAGMAIHTVMELHAGRTLRPLLAREGSREAAA